MSQPTPELWTLPLRLLSPAAVGGAEPNTRAELRLTSLRGALRSWYRLLVGPRVAAGGREVAEELRPLSESQLLGGLRSKAGQSRVLFSLREPAPEGEEAWNNRELRGRWPGLAYLAFSLDMRPNQRRTIPAGTTFELRLLLPRGLAPASRALLGAALWLWIQHGGVGSRSRRGLGALALAGDPSFRGLSPGSGAFDQPLPSPGKAWQSWQPKGDLNSLAQWVDRGLVDRSRALALAGLGSAQLCAGLWGEEGPVPAYVLLHEETEIAGAPRRMARSRLLLWAGANRQGFASAREALNELGQAFSQKRKERGVDGLPMGALRMLSEGKRLPQAPRRAAFGLPLALRPMGPSAQGPGFELLPHLRSFSPARAPSPLLFSLLPMGPRFALSLTLLSGPWPGRDMELRERREKFGFIPAEGKGDLPLEFLRGLPGALELPL